MRVCMHMIIPYVINTNTMLFLSTSLSLSCVRVFSCTLLLAQGYALCCSLTFAYYISLKSVFFLLHVRARARSRYCARAQAHAMRGRSFFCVCLDFLSLSPSLFLSLVLFLFLSRTYSFSITDVTYLTCITYV